MLRAETYPTRDLSVVLETHQLYSNDSILPWELKCDHPNLGCTHRVTAGRFAGKFDLNFLITAQRNFTFKQERGFTKRKTAVRS